LPALAESTASTTCHQSNYLIGKLHFYYTAYFTFLHRLNQHMKRILPAIVISQFFCTSVWFAGNAVIADIMKQVGVHGSWLAHMTSAVQFGFIIGTLTFAILAIADRFSPVRVFTVCAMLAAAANLSITFPTVNATAVLMLRMLTGFFLAGIYPVGMKIAADHHKEGLSKSLGFLVGALVLGTALPHLLKAAAIVLNWKYVCYTTSLLAATGGLIMLLLVPDGPYHKPAQKLEARSFLRGFGNKQFRSAALGYFGHMWELYTFWMSVPVILAFYKNHHPEVTLNIPLWSFLIIASGSISCILGGYISKHVGVKTTATSALLISCICCLASPVFLQAGAAPVFLIFLFIWGMSAVADSPLFSTITATNAPPSAKAASLTIVNCIGFSITIISIQSLNAWINASNAQYIYMLLAAGPLLGLAALLAPARQ
jgi:MFS family permease